MPYFVYRIAPSLQLTHIDTKDLYQDAREIVRDLRERSTETDQDDYRLIFAEHQAVAEKLLSKPRDGRIIGED